MNHAKLILFCGTIALLAACAGGLKWLQVNQRLGEPGIKANPIPGSIVMDLALPEHVLDFTSEQAPEPDIVKKSLPADTSFVQRNYTAKNGLQVQANIVLMGADRSSIHKPEICLPGQGWRILRRAEVPVQIESPRPYQLPVMKWVIVTSLRDASGRQQEVRGLYVYWFVARDEETTSHFKRVWWIARDLITTGVLQRWAYVSYFAVCQPGQEDAAFEQVKKLIAASVPEFQLPPKATGESSIALK